MAFFILYNVIFAAAGVAAAPFLISRRGRYGKDAGQKLGIFTGGYFPEKKGMRIWLNAVSVGEVIGLAAVAGELGKIFPDAEIVVSTGTPSGRETARRLLEGRVAALFYAPLDFLFFAAKTAEAVKPDIYMTFESEIWPGLLWILRRRGTSLLLVNGRLSSRSFRMYYLSRFFWKRVLGFFDCIAMSSERDRRRMLALGAPGDGLCVMGNSKHDALAARMKEDREDEMRELLSVGRNRLVFIAASLHPSEFRAAAESCAGLLRRFPGLLCIAVPRHPPRARELAAFFGQRGFDCYFRSRAASGSKRSGEPVIIVDVLGELLDVYSLATAVFCGGSLNPLGGQNIFEPAAKGKPVIYGPYMENFIEEKRLLEAAGAGFTAGSAAELTETAASLLADPDSALKAGKAGREAVLGTAGAARKAALAVERLVSRTNIRNLKP